MTIPWRGVTRELRGLMKPRFMTFQELSFAIRKSQPDIHGVTIHRWIKDMCDAGLLIKVQRDLYANTMATPHPNPTEAAHLIRPGAIVSLQSVLGEMGAANNPSSVVTAIIPVSKTGKAVPEARQGGGLFGEEAGSPMTRPRAGEVTTNMGRFEFYSMPERLCFLNGVREDSYLSPVKKYRSATPEKALADWLYLSQGSRNIRLSDPPLDMDLTDINMNALHNICQAMSLEGALEQWLSQKAQYDADENVQYNMNTAFGF